METTTVAGQDALSLLKQDHDEVAQLFARCEQQAEPSNRDEVVRHICRELKVHTEIEERVFYPALREKGVDDHLLNEATHEHQEAKQLIAQIEGTSGGAVVEPLKRLMAAVRHHVQEEESEMFEAARRSGVDLDDLGRRLAECKREVKQQFAR